MSKLYLKGCGTALVTPFKDNCEVDYEAYAACVDRQVEAGVHFLVPLATTGETPTLSSGEKKELLRITREHVGGMPLLAGCGTNSLDGTLANMELLDDCGADAWLVVVPYYNKPTPEGQYRYFKEIAARSGKPIVIYNVPGRTGANMTADTAMRLAEDCPNIVGIKEASGRYDQVSEMIRRAPEGFSVLSGDDDMTLALMATRGAGGGQRDVRRHARRRPDCRTRAAPQAFPSVQGLFRGVESGSGQGGHGAAGTDDEQCKVAARSGQRWYPGSDGRNSERFVEIAWKQA